MLQATKLGSFNIMYNAIPECQDIVESFIVEANLSTRAFSDSLVCDRSLSCDKGKIKERHGQRAFGSS
jgi:hypothetical protein